MEINTKDYSVQYDRATQTVTFCGSFRLSNAEEWAQIVELLDSTADGDSSGINVLSKFVIKVRQQKHTHVAVKGSQNIPWQGKSLKNLQRLMPALYLELE
jgi:hypothetical protein